MAINFPSNPSLGTQHRSGNRVWQWDGVTWKTVSTPLRIATSMIPNNTITGVMLQANSTAAPITSSKIADDAVTLAKLDRTGDAGTVLASSASGATAQWVTIPTTDSTQVLPESQIGGFSSYTVANSSVLSASKVYAYIRNVYSAGASPTNGGYLMVALSADGLNFPTYSYPIDIIGNSPSTARSCLVTIEFNDIAGIPRLIRSSTGASWPTTITTPIQAIKFFSANSSQSFTDGYVSMWTDNLGSPYYSSPTVTYTATGVSTYTVPENTTLIRAKLWGSGGGSGQTNGWNVNSQGGYGGSGGFIQGDIPVTPGEILTVFVPPGGLGGYVYDGGGGGGTWAGIFRGATPLMIAGGGGGGGGGRINQGGNGGYGGGLIAGDGLNNPAYATSILQHGNGGTQDAGGAGGNGDGAVAKSGSLYSGGYGTGAGGHTGSITNGASILGANYGIGGAFGYDSNRGSGGGGGGGYYGGGGAGPGGDGNDYGGGGGGGGSSYADGTVTVTYNVSGKMGAAATTGTAQPPTGTDPNYIAGKGYGGKPPTVIVGSAVQNGGNGGPGMVYITALN